MYFSIEADDSIRKVSHLNYAGGEGWGVDFLKGVLIELPKKPSDLYIKFECEKLNLPDFIEVDGAPVANNKLKEAFDSVGADNYQAFPVDIQFSDGQVSEYYLYNILGRINCIDKDASDYSSFGPSIARIFDLKLNVNAIHDAHMFRDRNYQEIVFVSEQVKKAIESKNITGCEFWEADGWNDSHRF